MSASLLVGLVSVPAAAATDDTANATATSQTTANGDRARVVALWRTGGPTTRAAAEKVLLGSDTDVRAFFEKEYERVARIDDRIRVNRMLASGGPTVKDAAQKALDADNDAALREFLASGWKTPSEHDLRIRVNQMLAAGGPTLKQAAQKALDAEDAKALEEFLKSGWKTPWEHDQRIRVNQILASGGPEVKKVAQRALDAENPEALTEFLTTDWPVAQARDQETATVSQLAGLAQDASAEAARETEAAKQAAAQAIKEAELARQAAERARRAMDGAQNNAQTAAGAAREAAQAALGAAQAAREAVDASNAARAAAQVAANAAARAASAAALAGRAASRAHTAAANAVTDATKASEARQAADAARDAARGAEQAANAAGEAETASKKAEEVGQAAAGSARHAADAADAANDASRYAGLSAAEASRARQAAATARAQAHRATRAANAATALARQSADAARRAREAATRAAQDAYEAARAADEAAEHAGNAAEAANRATAHANAASQAAQRATEAANQAREVYELARKADAERLAARTEQAQEAARAAAEALKKQEGEPATGWDTSQAAQRDADTQRWLTDTTAPDANQATVVDRGRRIALRLASTATGTWTRAAAESALRGSEAEVVDFVRNGLERAAGQDDRLTLTSLAGKGTENFREAAEKALAGSDADVRTLLETREYPGGYHDIRIQVNRILATAQRDGRVTTRDAAQKALDADDDGHALREFLTRGQYLAAGHDDRIRVNRILAADTSGPELKAAAQVALDGTPAMLRQFLVKGQHVAAQRDHDTATHNALVAGHVARAIQAAADANRNAADAQVVAARARAAADEANRYAQQADQYAQRAQQAAQDAQRSAAEAEKSARQAAASAKTAQDAASSARNAAYRANLSAALAAGSAQQAASYARDAYASAQRARAAAEAAGKDAKAAAQAAADAWHTVKQKYVNEKAPKLLEIADTCDHLPGNFANSCLESLNASLRGESAHYLKRLGDCEFRYGEGTPGAKQCAYKIFNPWFEFELELDLAQEIVTYVQAFTVTLAATAVLSAGIGCILSTICGGLLLAIAPDGMAFFPGWQAGVLATGAVSGGVRLAGFLGQVERSSTQANAAGARLAAETAKVVGRPPGFLPPCVKPANSFTANTPVLMADGSAKPIKNVAVGDMVIATEPVSGTIAPRAVSRVIAGHGTKHLVDITVNASTPTNNNAVVTATTQHPIWSEDSRSWVDAKDLKTGEHLRTRNGQQAVVTGTNARTAATTVYNLDVEDLHTYYVLAGTTPILVHNTGGGCLDHIALGKSIGLDEFAKGVGARHLMKDQDWRGTFITAAALLREDPTSVRLSFRLDDMPDIEKGVESAVYSAVHRDILGRGSPADWELATLKHMGVLKHVNFYLGDKLQPNPF
ncbi:polymorphic toxin-type HINT domain-containing protein [Longimycelium tulufanense]|uniref:polymorphic toxin-type HINT domain-containing protein n=1 Tax=Longimycelium tulufanense TaxID=907463 RepID=UPI0016682577|nr:polymorphic toxin-type HINT domain-containing protein [Longimycelium tulufanense]